MALTVKQVAAISGVSVRTLHFYEEAGLLKPDRNGAGYRTYGEAQLLILQQILFYRKLGFRLKHIREVLNRPDFEKVAALRSHRKVLNQGLAQTRTLIETIDHTIAHLKGGKKVKSAALFQGFSVGADRDRFGERIRLGGPGGEPMDCKVSGKDTDGAMCAFEFTCQSGGPRHAHEDQDEWIYVLDGEFEFYLGPKRKRIRLGAGGSIFIPRKTPHVWACASGRPGRIVNVYQPAGPIEAFFREVGRPFEALPTAEQMAQKTYTDQQVESLHRFFAAHGMDLLGPPLAFDPLINGSQPRKPRGSRSGR